MFVAFLRGFLVLSVGTLGLCLLLLGGLDPFSHVIGDLLRLLGDAGGLFGGRYRVVAGAFTGLVGLLAGPGGVFGGLGHAFGGLLHPLPCLIVVRPLAHRASDRLDGVLRALGGFRGPFGGLPCEWI